MYRMFYIICYKLFCRRPLKIEAIFSRFRVTDVLYGLGHIKCYKLIATKFVFDILWFGQVL